MKLLRLFFLLCSLLSYAPLKAQSIVNAYAKVTSVTGLRVLALSNVDQTSHTFSVGESVIIMQMQDNVIGTNTANTAAFGNIAGIANAGNYEVRIISAISPTTGTPTSMTLATVLTKTFNTGANSAVQIISLRNLGNNFTTTSNITGKAWNGSTGGVVAIAVINTLTLNHSILADGIGFRGGSFSDSPGGDFSCINTSYISAFTTLGAKGEGIYLPTVTSYSNGRGKIINGGGGGAEDNAGGGGGSNFSTGGKGGLGYLCSAANSGSGLGGINLNGFITVNRVFMGGGGGGGQQNDFSGTTGGNGGGIILISAKTLSTNSGCAAPISISASGMTAANSGNDGSGGGGAGGSIVFQVTNYSVNAACSLTISANGGNGGNVTDVTPHGGGGGGGQGVVIFSTVKPTTNITTQVNNGSAGKDDTGGTTSATGGGGTNGSGTVVASSGPLPVELIYFNASLIDGKVKLNWETASELNNKSFLVEKSNNGIDFVCMGSLNGAGTTSRHNYYEMFDNRPLEGYNYYRLKHIDYNEVSEYSHIIVINFDESINFSLQPNPADKSEPILVNIINAKSKGEVYLSDVAGNNVYHNILEAYQNQIQLSGLNLEKGIYFLKVQIGQTVKIKKLVLH